jgi:hypothetical protein
MSSGQDGERTGYAEASALVTRVVKTAIYELAA